jgi:hypothetical protein
MRNCQKCGKTLPGIRTVCPECGERSPLPENKEKSISRIIYLAVLTVSVIYAFFFLASGLCELFASLTDSYYLIDLLPLPFVYLFTPLALAVFIITVIINDESRLLITLPAAGIAAEIAQFFLKHKVFLDMAFEKYMQAILLMELFSAILVIVFFSVMIRFTVKGFTISQSRILIAAAFVLVFARVVLKYSMSDEADFDELIGYTSNIKFYIMTAAALLNVKKRYINSMSCINIKKPGQ